MKLAVLRVEQSGRGLFLGTMSAEQILACSHTAEWDPDLGWDLSQQGYQRAPVTAHFQAIGRFLNDNPNAFMPTSALLSARAAETGKLKFSRLSQSQGTAFGELEIEDWRQLVIVDCQHRWRGFRYAIEDLGDFEAQ